MSVLRKSGSTELLVAHTLPRSDTSTAASEIHDPTDDRPTDRPTGHLAGPTLTVIAFGTLLIAIGYAAGRSHQSWAEVPFWLGQIVSFLAIAIGVTSRRLGSRSLLAIVIAQAAQQSLVRWMYSPLFFAFPDELLHQVTATDILTSHHLFHANLGLTVSPAFPGLEEITTAMVSISHFGLFAAGMIVAATSHVAFSIAVFYLARRVTHDGRTAAVVAALFATNPHQASFASEFIYENPALLFFAVALYGATARRGRSLVDVVPALACIGAVVVTHHVTAAMTILVLAALGILTGAQTRFSPLARRLLWLSVGGAIWAAIWVLSVGSATVTYLTGPLNSIIIGVESQGHGKGGTVPVPLAPGSSVVGRILQEGAAVATVILIVTGLFLLLRRTGRGDRSPLFVAFATLSLGYFGILIIRLTATNGADLAARLLTYEALFVSVAAAVVLAPSWRPTGHWLLFPRRAVVVTMLLIFVGSMLSGWPAQWEIVPGTFRIDGFESGIDRQNTAAAQWFGAHVGPGRRVACDFSLCSLLEGYANANYAGNVAAAYYARTMSSSVLRVIRNAGVQYLFVDRRLSTGNPIAGEFFDDATGPAPPIDEAALDKFAHDPRIDLIYNAGDISIYDVRGLLDAR